MPRINPKNRPIRALPQDHPAHATLLAHRKCRRDCVGREIVLPGHESEAIDQEWYSTSDGRQWKFSTFAYTFLSFDLVLHEWLDTRSPFDPQPTLQAIAKMLTLLDECELSCHNHANERLLELLPTVRRFLILWAAATRLRAMQR